VEEIGGEIGRDIRSGLKHTSKVLHVLTCVLRLAEAPHRAYRRRGFPFSDLKAWLRMFACSLLSCVCVRRIYCCVCQSAFGYLRSLDRPESHRCGSLPFHAAGRNFSLRKKQLKGTGLLLWRRSRFNTVIGVRHLVDARFDFLPHFLRECFIPACSGCNLQMPLGTRCCWCARQRLPLPPLGCPAGPPAMRPYSPAAP